MRIGGDPNRLRRRTRHLRQQRRRLNQRCARPNHSGKR
jgi:hypothetical protein